MDAFKLTKTLKLHETDGWYSVPFIQGTNTSFYTEIIENKSLTIAWVAIQNKHLVKLELKIRCPDYLLLQMAKSGFYLN
jgi:hypothetical protein